MDYQTTLLEVLKRRLLEVEGPLEFGNGEGRTRKLYYLKRLEDNLAVPMSDGVRAMYEGGSGNELDWKMCSIRSSSAMTFNLLGNGPVRIAAGEHAGSYGLAYEYRLPTLRSNPHPANLDAYLMGGGGDIYCEMKMLEWLGAPRHALRPDYLDPARYLVPRGDAERFVALFGELASVRAEGRGGAPERLSGGRYDGLQMAKHLLAIFGRLVNDAAYAPARITLLNCVWELEDPSVLGRFEQRYLRMREEEHEGFGRFAELVAEHVAPLFEARGVRLSVEYVTACGLMDAIEYGEACKAKLGRYVTG